VNTASTAPAAPSVCPVAPFVEEIGVRLAFSSPRASLRLDSCVGERHLQRARAIRAGWVDFRDVVRVGRDAVADHLGSDSRTAADGVFQLLEHDHGCSFGHHESVATGIEGPRCARGVVVARRERAHGAETGHHGRRDRRLGAAAQHHIGATQADCILRVADCDVRRGAGRRFGEQRPACPELDRDPGRGQVGEHLHDRERIDAVGPSSVEGANALFERPDAADRARDRDADPFCMLAHVDAGVGRGLSRGRHHQV
jgi:hypothetical protein